MRNLVVDCEILNDPTIYGWNNYKALKITVAVVWDIDSDEWFVFTDNPHIEGTNELGGLPKLLHRNNVIGYNVKRFDIPLIRANAGDFTPGKITDLWDAIYEKTGQMISLQHIVTNLGIGSKTLPSGAYAPILWQAGKYREVIEYCKNDVLLEGKLHKLSKEVVLEFPDRNGGSIRVHSNGDRYIVDWNPEVSREMDL